MAACRFCGEKAGLLKSAHQECTEKHDAGLSKLSNLAFDALLRLERSLFRPDIAVVEGRLDDAQVDAAMATALEPARQQLKEVRSSSFCSQEEETFALISAWRRGLETFTSDKYLSASEAASLNGYYVFFQIPMESVNDTGGPCLTRADLGTLWMFSAVSDLQRGRFDDMASNALLASSVAELPIILEKGEALFHFMKMLLAENRTIRSYGGGYGGFSVRVAPGLYTRVGAFRGHPIETTSVEAIDTGIMALTDRQIYFSGPKITLKIRYGSIVALEAFADGIGVRTESGRPQIFIWGEQHGRPGLSGWFLHSVISLLCQRAAK